MGARGAHYGGIVLDGLVFHTDAAKQESYTKTGMRYIQNGNNSLFVDFADTYVNPSYNNSTGTIINGVTFSNFAPYHLSDYSTPYFFNTENLDIFPTEFRNSEPIWSTLEHSWDANGNTNDGKGTAHGIVVTPVGQTYSLSTMTYQSGKVGSGAFSFNGSNFISLPENTLKFTSDFSISLWFYVPAGLTDSNLISSFDNKGDYTEYNGWSISYNNTTKSINFFIGIKMGAAGNPGSQYYGISLTTGNNVFLMDQWNHVLITRKANTRSRIYVNGALSISDTNIYNPSYHALPNLSYIGASYYAFSQPFYTGAPTGLKIDVVETFTSELNSTDATNLYTMSNIYSSIALNNNGIGTFYGNLEFDGVNDYVSFGSTPEMDGIKDITVSAWFYVNKFKSGAVPTGGTTSIIASRYNGVNGWALGYNNKGVLYFDGRESGAEYLSVTASIILKSSNSGLTANGGWYNAVGTKSGNVWKVYVSEPNRYIKYNTNAQDATIYTYPYKQSLLGTRTMGVGTTTFTTNNLYLGCVVFGTPTLNMDGRLMSLSVYNRALSLSEINQNYDSFSKRLVKTAFDRGLNNNNVLITYDTLNNGDITNTLAGISTRETALGKNVTVIAGYANLPNDLSSFSHIWDIDIFTGQLVTLNSSKYTTYLQNGGALFLLGERAQFTTRNNTLVTFLNSMGAGPIVLDLVYDSTSEQEVQNQFLLANSNSVVSFPNVGRYSSIGTGIPIIKSKVVEGSFPIGTTGAAVLWKTGSLSNAPKGAIVSVMDVNIWQSTYSGAPWYGSDFTNNISLILDRF